MGLKEYLASKPLYYEKIDYSRMPRIYEKIKEHFEHFDIIHVIGTNGKGTTGRFLAEALFSMGFRTGHYTSPHIMEFNERIWLNGENASYKELEAAHKELQDILTDSDADSLSYFEYTTLLAMLVFRECEYIVMEAGLGGEYDATAVFPKILTLVTPIAYDHEAFLGSNIKEIATTKANAIQNSAVIAKQRYNEVYDVLKDIGYKKSLNIYNVNELLNEKDENNIKEISKELSLAPYLTDNLSLSVAALKFLKLSYEVKDFKNGPLFGRLTKIKENIILDVGHNTLAAQSLLESLRGKKYILVYNSYKDKKYKEILSILKPIILHVEIIEVKDARIEALTDIQKSLNDLDIQYRMFNGIKEQNEYLVFGSFSVVETFLREYYE